MLIWVQTVNILVYLLVIHFTSFLNTRYNTYFNPLLLWNIECWIILKYYRIIVVKGDFVMGRLLSWLPFLWAKKMKNKGGLLFLLISPVAIALLSKFQSYQIWRFSCKICLRNKFIKSLEILLRTFSVRKSFGRLIREM